MLASPHAKHLWPHCLALVGCTSLVGVGCARPAVEISRESYLGHVAYLAGDALKGRGVGTEGIDRAAEYIAARFREHGVEPAGVDGTYFQLFEVHLGGKLTGKAALKFSGVDADCDYGSEFVTLSFSSADRFSGEMMFCGYGIANPQKDYDDFRDLDLTGKVVLVLRREPAAWTDEAGGYTTHAEFSYKVYNARERGAAAVLIVNRNDTEDTLPAFRSGTESSDVLQKKLAEARARAARARARADRDRDESRDRSDTEDTLPAFRSGAGRGMFGLPAMQITRALADKLLSAGGAESLDVLQAKLDDTGAFCSTSLPGIVATGDPGIRKVRASARNVLGLIRGHGPHADEYVVVGAHYDHLGEAIPRSTFAKHRQRRENIERQIHNGADDNASGTAGVIEAAAALAKADDLGRSVLLMAFTAEESGLLGSTHFLKHPTVPREKIVAMVNMDMIGRMRPGKNEVYVFGTQAADEFKNLLQREARRVGLTINGDASAAGGMSDHSAFYRRKIPAVLLFTGLHRDYHRPSDDTDKINEEDAVRIVQMAYGFTRELSRLSQRPTYHAVAAKAPGGNPSYRVVMGIMPGYADDGEPGMLVEGVLEGGPANQAGLHDQDRILSIGRSEVNNIYDYMGALRGNKPGDEVEVVVQRGAERLTLTVKLAVPP